MNIVICQRLASQLFVKIAFIFKTLFHSSFFNRERCQNYMSRISFAAKHFETVLRIRRPPFVGSYSVSCTTVLLSLLVL